MNIPSICTETVTRGCRSVVILILAWIGLHGCSSDDRVADVPIHVGPNPQNEACMACHGDSDALKEMIPNETGGEGESTEDG